MKQIQKKNVLKRKNIKKLGNLFSLKSRTPSYVFFNRFISKREDVCVFSCTLGEPIIVFVIVLFIVAVHVPAFF